MRTLKYLVISLNIKIRNFGGNVFSEVLIAYLAAAFTELENKLLTSERITSESNNWQLKITEAYIADQATLAYKNGLKVDDFYFVADLFSKLPSSEKLPQFIEAAIHLSKALVLRELLESNGVKTIFPDAESEMKRTRAALIGSLSKIKIFVGDQYYLEIQNIIPSTEPKIPPVLNPKPPKVNGTSQFSFGKIWKGLRFK